MVNKYDIIVIGSGLGGLICATILSMEGMSVCVLEQANIIGGALQSFKRKNTIIDTGIHYVGSMREGQILNQYFKYLQLSNIKGGFLDSDFDKITLASGEKFSYYGGYTDFYKNLASLFPKQKSGLKRYCSKIKQIGETISVENHSRGLLSSNGLEYLAIGADDFINSCINDKRLKDVLLATNTLYGGVKEKSSLYHHAMTLHSNIEGAYKFYDGTQRIADTLAQVIRGNGGTLLTNKKVINICSKDKQIESITTQDGEVFIGDRIISSIHPAVTFNMINDNPIIRGLYKNRLNTLPQTYGFFSANLIFKHGGIPYINKNYHFYNSTDIWDTVSNINSSPKFAMLTFQKSLEDTISNSVATIMAPVSYNSIKEWENTTIGKRGDLYKEAKSNFAKSLISFAEQKTGISLTNNISEVFTSTPLTYRDYLNTPLGSAYGYIKDYKNPMSTLFPAKTKFNNLFLTGQNLNAHGAIGVTLTAATTCAEILGSEYLAKKIASK